MKSFFHRLSEICRRSLSFLKFLLLGIFGSLNYTAPIWWTKMAGFIHRSWVGRQWDRFVNWKTQNPLVYRKRTMAGVATVVVLAGAGIGFRMWWFSRPIPDYVTMSASAPQPTDPETKKPQELRIQFSKSVIRPEQLNKPVTAGLKIKPQMMGTWTWSSDRTLVFTPDLSKNDWAVGQAYEVDFEKKLFADHLIFDSLEVEFTTQALRVNVTKHEFYIDPRNPDLKKVVVNFTTNYPVKADDLRNRMNFILEDMGSVVAGKKMPFLLTSNKFMNEFYAQSESLPVPKVQQTMKVSVDKGLKAMAGGPGTVDVKSAEVVIPSLYEGFGISEVRMAFARNEKFEPEQIIVVETKIAAKSEDVAANLQVKLLPKDRPAGDGESLKTNFHWGSASQASPELLKSSEKVELTLVPSETEWSKLHTFKIQTEPKRYLFLAIARGLKGIGGYELKDNVDNVLRVDEYPKELSLMSQGAILTLSGDLKLPLLARNISQVTFRLHRIIPEQVNHILYQMSQDVKNPSIPYGLESQIAEKFESEQTLKIESAKATQYFSFDLQPFLNKASVQKGIFLFEVRDKNSGVSDRRLIMITDLGILTKETVAKNHEVFVQNFRTGQPVSGATVEVVGNNGLTVLSAQTDTSGHVSFPDLKKFRDEKQPLAFSVRQVQDQAFLPFRNSAQNLQYSRFDVGGLREDANSDQLMSMLFSDRGMYRPGEEVHMGLIVRSKKGQVAKQRPQLEWVVTNPKGNKIFEEKLNLGAEDLKDFDFKTEDTSPTGTYTVQVFLIKKEHPYKEVDLLATQTVRVEEFQPDRMKISSHLQEQKLKGWIKPQEMKAFVSLKNMFGTTAENRNVKAELTLSPASPRFKDYKDYSFSSLNKSDEQVYNETLGETKSNDKGEAEFSIDLRKYQAALFDVRLDVEGFESEGGRSVRSSSGTLVSPLDFILGAKADGDLYYINKGSERSINVIAIDSDLKLTAADKLKLAIIERKSVSVLTKDQDGTYKYQSVKKEVPVSEKDFTVGAKGTDLKIDSAKPGDFTFVFKNSAGLEVLKVNYSIVGESNLAKALDRNAELQLSLNKSDFKNGEEIQMQIRAPYTGAGLITIERDGIYASKWFKTGSTTTVETIKVPEGLDGNAYVNVTFLRAIDSTEIYASPLSYAVAPFSVSLDEHRTKVKIDAPALVKPGQKLKVQYSADRKTQIILYGVDEGILQVAKYKLPDPLSYFFQKRALQVKTYQMLDLLLPEFSILQQMQATGGDEGLGAIGKNINPFKSKRIKPVVFWTGVIQADSTKRTFTFEVPETFNGNLRLMAVSAGKTGLGSIQADALVRGDLIISPNVPMFVAPQDEFVVGVSVSNQTEGSGAGAQVKLETVPSSHFTVMDGKTLDLKIAEGHEGGSEVRVKTADKLGVGLLTFKASLGNAKAQLKMEVSVRPSTPFSQFLQVGVFDGTPVEIKQARTMHSEYGSVSLLASASPLVSTAGLMEYLEAYPYGCTEQLISRNVPSLVLRSVKDYVADEKKLKDGFQKVVAILRSRQKADGGFALYSPLYEQNSNVPASLYAAHYLIEAKSKGVNAPEDMLSKVKSFLEMPELRSAEDLSKAQRWAYSLYLGARLGVVNGASLSQLRRELDQNFKGKWEDDVIALYLSGTYALYRQEEMGEKLIKKLSLGTSKMVDYDDYIDPLTRDAILLYMVGKHFPSQTTRLLDAKSLAALMKPINEGRYHTHAIGWLLMAFDVVGQSTEAQTAVASLKLEVIKAGAAAVGLEPTKQSPKTWKPGIEPSTLKLTGSPGIAFWSFQSAGFDKVMTPVKQGIEVGKQYRNAAGKEVQSVKVGDEITVHLQVRSLDQATHTNVAVVDLIPSGFEMVAERRMDALEGGSSGESEGQVEGDGGEGGGPSDVEPGGGWGEDTPPPPPEESESGEGAFLRLILNKAYAQTTTTSLQALQVDFVDEREDRMILYATVTPDLSEYTYRIKAINKGKFVRPPGFAEGMYNRDLKFVDGVSSIEVTGP